MAWLSGYTYRKKKPINSTAAGAQTNYQMKLLVGESSGASGEEIDCESHCQDFPNDVRFTRADGMTKHDYWLESVTGITPNRLATFQPEVDSIPSSGDVDLYMSYGKSEDSGESNGEDTFPFFDDFTGVTINEKYHTSWSKSGSNPLQTKTCQNWFIVVYSNYNNEDKIYLFEQRNAAPSTTISAWSFTRANAANTAQWTDHGTVFTGAGAHDDGHVEPHGIIFETQSMADAREGVSEGLGTPKWRMYYCAKGNGENPNKYSVNFAYASESDLTSWTAYASNPVYDHDATYGYADCKVCIYGSKVWMHHCKYTNAVPCNPLFFSVSDDGISSWTDKTTNWNTEMTVAGTLVPFSTGILLSGNPTSPDRYAAYFTTDGDDKATYSGNPILSLGAGGQWDDYNLAWYSIVVDKNGSANLNSAGTYYMYYIGMSDASTYKLGLATSTTLTEESETRLEDWSYDSGTFGWDNNRLKGIGDGVGEDNAIANISTHSHYAIEVEVEKTETNKLASFTLNYNGANRLSISLKADGWVYYLNTGGWVKSSETYLANTKYKCKIIVNESTHTADYYFNDVLLASGQGYYAANDDPNEVAMSLYQSTSTMYFDNLFVRKYANPEPTWGTSGAEETEGLNMPIAMYHYRRLRV